MVFTTEGFFEGAIESWPEWDLNPRPLNSVQTLSGHEFNSHSEPTFYNNSNFYYFPNESSRKGKKQATKFQI